MDRQIFEISIFSMSKSEITLYWCYFFSMHGLYGIFKLTSTGFLDFYLSESIDSDK